RFNLAEHGADRVALTQLYGEFFQAAVTRRSDRHGGFVRLDFDQILIRLHRVPRFDQKIDNFGLGNGLAELRHDDGNLRHNFLRSSEDFLPPPQCCAWSGGAPSINSDDTAPGCPWR